MLCEGEPDELGDREAVRELEEQLLTDVLVLTLGDGDELCESDDEPVAEDESDGDCEAEGEGVGETDADG